MIKRLMSLLLCLLLPAAALGEAHVVNLIDTPDASYAFAPDAPILEIVYPRIHGSDACILRMGEETMMVDASTVGQRDRVATALKALGITRINTAINTHPHDDHLPGFVNVLETASIDRLLITFPADFNQVMKRTLRAMPEVPVSRVSDGDVISLGGATLTVIQRDGKGFTVNDQSAMLMLRYGERTLLMAADVENRAQAALIESPPEGGLRADILKYPHHGQVKLRREFFEMISPELSIATAAECDAKEGYNYMKLKHVPMLTSVKGMLRLRTDGFIWVVDYLTETAER